MSLSGGLGFRLLDVFSDSCTQFFAELGILNITLLFKGDIILEVVCCIIFID
jgi:hypothetical protein